VVLGERFAPRVLLVRRDPLNALASWSDLGFGKDPRAIPGLARFAATQWGVVAPAPDAPVIERQAFIYGVGAQLLDDAARRHPEWIVVQHETLCTEPIAQLREITMRVGLPWSEAAEQYLVESDRDGSGYHTQRRALDQIERWRTRLSAEQVDGIRATLSAFPVHAA
jgi:hypothetical protein